MKDVLKTEVEVETYEKDRGYYGYKKTDNVIVANSVEDEENLISIKVLGGYVTVKGEELARAIQKCFV